MTQRLGYGSFLPGSGPHPDNSRKRGTELSVTPSGDGQGRRCSLDRGGCRRTPVDRSQRGGRPGGLPSARDPSSPAGDQRRLPGPWRTQPGGGRRAGGLPQGLQGASRLPPREAVQALAAPGGGQRRHRRHLQKAVRQAIASLPSHYRDAIALQAFGELSYGEIAKTLDIPLGTVMSRLNGAKRLLRERLGDLVRGEEANTA
ncbi:MAG: hypothetical protein E6I47_13815 [Chloroflexi bacterium]|nr:MAG: hypothetical protein E6I47_13815 [Chloroflexota bacterium]